ncbi:fimbria/pilus outer membrane usher protein [Achromobacter animicus]|uniref:fimbria/pilus outer membrane usher protein n=1 Tax=Achromobacter animicus TaxID=1389935 RepID=UPI0028AD09AE|nr:fimbria/pilus outer membrane usher protein [Achromobacter animicus]
MKPLATTPHFALAAITLGLLSATAWAAGAELAALDADVEFNDAFLGGANVDVSQFARSNSAIPGNYRLDVLVNDRWLGRSDVRIGKPSSGNAPLQACFDQALVDMVGIDLTKIDDALAERLSGNECVALAELVKEASAEFDAGEQRLNVTVPQASLVRQGRGYVDPKHWNEGVPAALLNYNTNFYTSRANGKSSTQSFAGLNAGANVGPWRLRHTGNATKGSKSSLQYQSVQTNLRRNITGMKSQLVIGDAFTDGSTFDSVGFRGVQMSSDDRMYPESQRGFAPTLRGIANTNARVQVRQNGNIIYETTVAPGPFIIDDLYATGYGGDLEMVVNEADGRVLVSRVPFSGAVNSLRPGVTRYSVTAGQYRTPQTADRPLMAQATVQHGINNLVTAYGGLTGAQGYAAVMGGAALNTDFGAFGLDVTQAATRLPKEKNRNGQSVKLSYSKFLAPTNTSLTLGAYRYSSRGYLSMADAMELRSRHEQGQGAGQYGTQRGRLQATINQNLPQGYGSVHFTGSTQDYWDKSGRDTQIQAGYSNNFKKVNYSVSATRQLNVGTQKWDNQVMLNVGIPLGRHQNPVYASTSLQKGSDGSSSVQQSVAGSLGADNAFNYGVSAGRAVSANSPANTNIAANASYLTPVTAVAANASTSSNYTQYGAGLSGGVVAYGGGVVMTPASGETVAIVEAKDAAGARVLNSSGVRLDSKGRAIVSTLTPYARNSVELDPKGLPLNVELKATEQHVAPTAGAVVRLSFETENAGSAALLTVTTPSGEPLPFGADVLDADGKSVGVVAQGGRVLARGLKDTQGILTVKWGANDGETCTFGYALSARPPKDGSLPQASGLLCERSALTRVAKN